MLESLLVMSLGVFCGAVVSSFAGFAFSPVAGALVFIILPHGTALPLLMMCSILLQCITLYRFRHQLFGIKLLPMMGGGAVGVLLAVLSLRHIDGKTFEIVFGLFLIAYCSMTLLGSRLVIPNATTPRREAAVGLAGGLVGALTATPGAIPVIYCNMRRVSKTDQRATVQPFILMMQVLALMLLIADGYVTHLTLVSFAMTVPALLVGIMMGMRLFGRVSEDQFQGRHANPAALRNCFVAVMITPAMNAFSSYLQLTSTPNLPSNCKAPSSARH